MSRRQKYRRPAPDPAEQIGTLKAIRDELSREYGRPASDAAIGQCAISRLNQRNWERDVMLGRPVPAVELEQYTRTLAILLGPPPLRPLRVAFIDDFMCRKCRTRATEEEAEAERVAKAAKAEAAEAVNATKEAVKASDVFLDKNKPAVPADAPERTPAPAPVNVVALHHAPLAHRDEPWRSHLQGERSGFRRFDIPKNF